MLQSGQQEFVDCRNALLNALTLSKERKDTGKASADNLAIYEKKLDEIEKAIEDTRSAANYASRIYKNIKAYQVEHQKTVQGALDAAILDAAKLVPDADTEGVHIKRTENNRAFIVNSAGQNINLREGGGYRAVLGALLAYACIRAQPDALQFLLFDESFFTLSDITVEEMKEVLMAMSKDLTIIGIEQRHFVMGDITSKEFVFKKDAYKNTSITERVMK